MFHSITLTEAVSLACEWPYTVLVV